MKIVVEYKENEPKKLKVDSAKYLSDYVIRIQFSDGIERAVDFKPFLSSAVHPSIKKYLDENNFSKFKVSDGNLNWNDYDLIFPVWDLYNNQINT